VTKLIRSDALAVLSALFAREYKILHLAGHGIYNAQNPAQSGMVLGAEMFLTAAELGQLRVVPELVFINCCHLGRIDEPLAVDAPNRLASSVAEELIKIGVRTVVAAGWAVADRAASTFASTFYQEMLEGRSFGAAVLAARQQTARLHARTNTWGAYQCYGNPDFVLVQTEQVAPRQERHHLSRREYLDELRSIAANVQAVGPAAPARTAGGCRAIEPNHPLSLEGRSGVGRLRHRLGRARGLRPGRRELPRSGP
jgi:hypothetical protein